MSFEHQLPRMVLSNTAIGDSCVNRPMRLSFDSVCVMNKASMNLRKSREQSNGTKKKSKEI